MGRREYITNRQKYENPNPIHQLLLRRMLQKSCSFLESLHPETVLDVGCGQGHVLHRVKELFPEAELHGIDTDEEAVSATLSRVPDATLRTMRLQELAGRQESYDLVICMEVLEHLERPAVGLRILKDCCQQAALLSVPWEPWFRLSNLARLRHIRRIGNHPEHLQLWSHGGFCRFVSSEFAIQRNETSFPWSIVLATPAGGD